MIQKPSAGFQLSLDIRCFNLSRQIQMEHSPELEFKLGSLHCGYKMAEPCET